MSDAPFKPAGAAFAALVAGLASAQAESPQAASGAEAQAARELEAALAALPALEPFAAPAAELEAEADVPLGGQRTLPF